MWTGHVKSPQKFGELTHLPLLHHDLKSLWTKTGKAVLKIRVTQSVAPIRIINCKKNIAGLHYINYSYLKIVENLKNLCRKNKKCSFKKNEFIKTGVQIQNFDFAKFKKMRSFLQKEKGKKSSTMAQDFPNFFKKYSV